MGSVFIVTGISGVGKTTVIKKALEGANLRMVTYGDVMAEILRERGLGKTNDDIRKITDVELYKQIQKDAAAKIYKMAEREAIVVDTHCAIKSANGYINGLPEWVVKPMQPKILVIIEGRPKEVIERRAKDPTRQRADFGGEEDVAEQQDVARAIAASVSGFTGARIKVILNEQGKLDEAARKLREVLQST